MARNLARPFFPIPPNEYRRDYMSAVVDAFSIYLQQVQNPGEMRGTKLVLTDLQSNDQGLEPGTLFEVEGVVHVSKTNMAYVAGNSAVAYVGTVTVAIT